MRAHLLLLSLPLLAQSPVDDIMAKVATNFVAGDDLRRGYVYTQKVNSRVLRTDKKVSSEEFREYTVIPGPNGNAKKLVKRTGQRRKGNQMVPYASTAEDRDYNTGGEGTLAESLISSLINDEKSRDGVNTDLFPFLPKDLSNYKFTLIGTKGIRGRPAHRIAFEAKEGANFEHPWAGEALIDMEDLHPVQIETRLAPKFPFVIRTLLGTNLRQSGFSVSYARVAPGVWFPATYGTEFRLDIAFLYKRIVTMSMESSDFRRVAADSTISFAPTP